jgi:hypothetical protein
MGFEVNPSNLFLQYSRKQEQEKQSALIMKMPDCHTILISTLYKLRSVGHKRGRTHFCKEKHASGLQRGTSNNLNFKVVRSHLTRYGIPILTCACRRSLPCIRSSPTEGPSEFALQERLTPLSVLEARGCFLNLFHLDTLAL